MDVHEMSERRACKITGADRSSVRYRHSRRDDAELRVRLRTLAGERRRFGYSRLHVLLRREGYVLNRKKTQRLYREEGLSVRKRKGRLVSMRMWAMVIHASAEATDFSKSLASLRHRPS
ncbi:transposase, partial [Sinorhizobium meliloti]